MNIADFHQQNGSGRLHAGMYADGIILYVPGGRRFARQVERLYRGEAVEKHRARDGETTAFVLRGEPCMRMMQAWCYTFGFISPLASTDNRGRDDNTIDLYRGLISRIGNAHEGWGGNQSQGKPATSRNGR